MLKEISNDTVSSDSNGNGRNHKDETEFSFVDLVENLVHYRWHFIVVAATIFLSVFLYAISATPVYVADALVQVEEKKGSSLGALSAVAKALDVQQSPVQGEVEIVRSRNVLGRAVESERAHTTVVLASGFPVFGKLISSRLARSTASGLAEPFLGLSRYSWGGEFVSLSNFVVPTELLGRKMTLIFGDRGKWELMDETGGQLLSGSGTETSSALQGVLSLGIDQMRGRPGTRFSVVRHSTFSKVQQLGEALTVAETRRQSGLLRLTFSDVDPDVAARMLNAVLDGYLEQNLERRSEEADKSLTFLGEQLPQLKVNLEAAEKRLNSFRNQEKSIDITGEIRALLERSAGLEKNRLELELKKKELLQRYEPQHPAVKSIDSQLSSLKSESGNQVKDINVLPKIQQEYIRLARDVEVNNQLYVGLLNNSQQLQVAKAGTTGNVSVVDRAVAPERPARPNKPNIVILGALVALLGGFLASQLVGFLSNVVREPKKLEQATGLQTLGILPIAVEQNQSAAAVGSSYLLAHEAPTSVPIEAMRSLRSAVFFALSETSRGKVVLVTSAVPGQGKSFISANLSYLAANGGRKVLLIDADVRRSTIGRYLAPAKNVSGLSSTLQDGVSAESLILRAVYPNLDVLPAGPALRNPGDLLSRGGLADLVGRMALQYDLIIIDSPPVLPVNDAAAMIGFVDVTLFVARQGLVTQSEVDEALAMLQRAGKRVTGVVFNGFVPSSIRYGYGYKYSYFQYGYKAKRYGRYDKYVNDQ